MANRDSFEAWKDAELKQLQEDFIDAHEDQFNEWCENIYEEEIGE